MPLCSCIHVVLCDAYYTVFMTQSASSYQEMDDLLLQYCYWGVNNRGVLHIINHEGTRVRLYRKHYGMEQLLNVCTYMRVYVYVCVCLSAGMQLLAVPWL